MEEKLLTEIRDLLGEIRDLLKEDRGFRKEAMAEAQKRAAESTTMMERVLGGVSPQVKAMFDPLRRKP
jgi:hypothetical protein